MANEKNTRIRERVIDRCLNDKYRKYTTKDIMEACNQELVKEGFRPVTSPNTIRDDMQAIEKKWGPYGGSIAMEIHGRNKFYHYKQENFSIYQAGLTPQDLAKLNETLNMLSRWKGLPQFAWMEELNTRLRSSFMCPTKVETVISFDENQFATGKQYIGCLFEAITEKKVLEIAYQSFHWNEPKFNSFILTSSKNIITDGSYWAWRRNETNWPFLALDRIKDCQTAELPYKENAQWNFEEYFQQVIGVSVQEDAPVQKIKLWVDPEQYKYIETKPLHGSQTLLEVREDQSKVIQLEVQENYELIQLLLSFGERVVVLEPEHIRKRIQQRIWVMGERYDGLR